MPQTPQLTTTTCISLGSDSILNRRIQAIFKTERGRGCRAGWRLVNLEAADIDVTTRSSSIPRARATRAA